MKYTVDTERLSDILDKMEKNQEVLVKWYRAERFVQYYNCERWSFLAIVQYSVDDLPGSRRRHFNPTCSVQFLDSDLELLFTLAYGPLT